MEWVVVVLAWLPVFMLGMYVGDVFKQKSAGLAQEVRQELEKTANDSPAKSSRAKAADRPPISIRPAFSTMEWHEADQDGDTLNEFFPKNERTTSFANVPSPIGNEISEVSPARKFKTSEVRMYASGVLKNVPQIRKKQATTPVIEQKATSESKIERT